MKKTFVTTMPDHVGAFLKASRAMAELDLNITRVSYNKAIDTHTLFIEAEGEESALKQAKEKLQQIGYLPAAATAFYGNYTTLVVPMFNLPPALIYPIATAAVPLLSATLAAGEQAAGERLVSSILRITSLIAMPCSIPRRTRST